MKIFWIVLFLAVNTAYGRTSCEDDDDCLGDKTSLPSSSDSSDSSDSSFSPSSDSSDSFSDDDDDDDSSCAWGDDDSDCEDSKKKLLTKNLLTLLLPNMQPQIPCTHEKSCPNGRVCFFGRCS